MEDVFVKMILAVLIQRAGGQVVITHDELDKVVMDGIINVDNSVGKGSVTLTIVEDRPAGSSLQ